MSSSKTKSASAPEGAEGLAKKWRERADLKEQDIIWIGIAASELNLQRLGALLLFADMPVVVEQTARKPLPWEDPNDPQYQKPPELEVDYDKIRRAIVAQMAVLVNERGHEKAAVKAVIQAHGADTLVGVPNDNLAALLRDLQEIK